MIKYAKHRVVFGINVTWLKYQRTSIYETYFLDIVFTQFARTIVRNPKLDHFLESSVLISLRSLGRIRHSFGPKCAKDSIPNFVV